ncbi:MAG: type VI secretion system protein ImpC [Lentisphaeria bacterium]|jgi:type VI secretion system protein ImpC
MSRTTISTGEIPFSLDSKQTQSENSRVEQVSPKTSGRRPGSEAPLRIALVGDFSGRASRGIRESQQLGRRKIIEIDRDNFEEVFSELQPTLQLELDQKAIHFREYDDLHPDYIYERVPLFDDLQTLKRRLGRPEQFRVAADEIRQWASYKEELNAPQASQKNEAERSVETDNQQAYAIPADMFDAVLSNSQASLAQQSTCSNSPVSNINQLIKDIVAPYVEPKADPRVGEMQSAVDEATTALMRRILHAPAFQNLEATWRSVYFLVRRLETNAKLKLYLVDVTCDEVLDDLDSAKNIEDTGLYSLLVEKDQVKGGVPFGVINVDFPIANNDEDLHVALLFTTIASANNGAAIAGASSVLAGCDSFGESEDCSDWNVTLEDVFLENWQDLRRDPVAAHLALTAPRVLTRLPYGQRSSPIESFPFEELPSSNKHEYYTWGSSAYVVTLLLAQSYQKFGWQGLGQIRQVDDLPLHVYDDNGETTIKPCAEQMMRDSGASRLLQMGLLPVRSVARSTSVVVPDFSSVARTGASLFS